MKNPTPYSINGVTGNRWDCKTNEEWRRERCHSIGASEIGALLGESPFKTPLQVVVTKREELAGNFCYEENEAMKKGHYFEGGVAKWLADVTGMEIIGRSASEYLMRRDDMPWLHASPDRTCWLDPQGPRHGKVSEGNKALVEVKTTSMPVDGDNLPVSWVFQVQTQLGVTGYRKGYLVWFSFATNSFGFREFMLDDEIFRAAVEVSRDAWERCVVGGENPDPVNGSDVALLWPVHTVGKSLTVDGETARIIGELRELKDAKRELENAIGVYTDMIKSKFTDEEAMVDSSGRVLCTFRANASGRRTLLIK